MKVKMEIDAIILAGGNADGLAESVSCKGIVPIRGRPMVEYVIDAVRASERIREIAVVLPDPGQSEWQGKVGKVVVNYGSVVDNFLSAADALSGHADRILALSGDVPLLTPQAIDNYLAACEPFDADLYYPIVRRADVERKFPGTQRTYMHLHDGVFTGGNIGLLNPAAISANRDLMESVFNSRKSPLKLVRILGLSFIFKFLLRRLTVAELEDKVSEIIGGKGRAVVVEYPEIGFDVDKPADLELAARFISGGTR